MTDALHVGLNGLFLAWPATGSGRYLLELARWLPRVAPEARYTLLAPTMAKGADERTTLALPDEWEIPYRFVRSPFDRRSENLAKLYLEQVSLPRAGWEAGATILHYPYLAAPLRSRLPVVVTVHDMLPLLLAEYRRSLRIRAYVALAAAAVRRAAFLITDSEAGRADLRNLLGIADSRIAVIPLAPARAYRPVEDPRVVEEVRRRHGLEDDYFIYLGGFERRKNVAALLRAFAAARGREGFAARLAIAGRLPNEVAGPDDPRSVARNLGIERAVVWLGPISDDDANALYNGTLGFVFPSRYEGFGLPPLEAMAAGAPVICSNASSLPEVVGDAALTFAPDDVAELTRALLRLAENADLRRRLRAASLARAARFSWERTARETAAVYAEVAARSAGGGSRRR